LIHTSEGKPGEKEKLHDMVKKKKVSSMTEQADEHRRSWGEVKNG